MTKAITSMLAAIPLVLLAIAAIAAATILAMTGHSNDAYIAFGIAGAAATAAAAVTAPAGATPTGGGIDLAGIMSMAAHLVNDGPTTSDHVDTVALPPPPQTPPPPPPAPGADAALGGT